MGALFVIVGCVATGLPLVLALGHALRRIVEA